MSYFEKIKPLSVTEVARKVLGWSVTTKLFPCPFHNESHGRSLSIYDDDRMWKCLGKCDLYGDAITLVMVAKDVPYYEACELIVEHFPDHFIVKPRSKPTFKYDEEHLDVFDTLTSLANFGSTRLFSHAKVLNYMKSNRLFSEDTIKKYLFGYISEEDFNNIEHYIDEYLNPDVLATFKKHVGRLLIPLFNYHGTKVIGFVSRTLSKSDTRKYDNDKNSDLKFGYHKKTYTYGYPQAKRRKPVVIVEGYLDAPSLTELGINTVAMGDCSLPEERLKYLSNDFSKLILGLDNDVTGVYRTIELKKKFSNMIFDYVLWDKDIKDGNDFLKSKRTTLMTGDYYEYICNLWKNNWNNIRNDYVNRKDFITRVRESLSNISFGHEENFIRCEIDKFIESVIAD